MTTSEREGEWKIEMYFVVFYSIDAAKTSLISNLNLNLFSVANVH